ncbi:hypothetical protein F4811DRAFT_548582 [Daldinia bambusicola]|nr:hypothetical protein F4811DRAFT_548582 [Daldinia bambusicola]
MAYAPPDPQARRQAILRLPYYLPGFPKGISGVAKAIHGLLSAQTGDNSYTDAPGKQNTTEKEICCISFGQLAHSTGPVDILSRATPERYRLVDCADAVSNRNLRILEFSEFPRVPYAALSYVWRGNRPADESTFRTDEFSVVGAEDADPIGLGVLCDACAASLACGASYLWVDRLCIVQTSGRDKRWQIREMYRIYTFCIVCIVAPSGIRFLVPFSEETDWIHRVWTLQEVVAPAAAAVLFAWSHGAGESCVKVSGETSYGRIEVVTPGTSAMMGLPNVLEICTCGYFDFTPDGQEKAATPIRTEAVLFGRPQTDSKSGSIITGDRSIRLPHVTALGFAAANYLDTEEMRDYCVWQCAFVRTSSCPVDMVFSIMGLLGVMLDPSEFSKDDRLGATIALARGILRQGRSASWLGLVIDLPPCPYLSTFPMFPQTSVAGRAMVARPDGTSDLVTLTDAIYPNEIGVFPPISGSMDEIGFHSFEALAIEVVALIEATILPRDSLYDDPARPTQLRAVDGSVWSINSNEVLLNNTDELRPGFLEKPRSFALALGFYSGMPAVTTGNRIRAMLVTECAEDRYYVHSYFLLNHEALKWVSTWRKYEFCVGGPKTYKR